MRKCIANHTWRAVGLLAAALCAVSSACAPADSGKPADPAARAEKLKEWRRRAFGMFIHWGVYSRLGGEWRGHVVEGYAEHIFRKERIPLEVYRKEVAAKFNPTEFDADEWVRIAKEAGMRYMVITAKHHDGFAMWPSKVNDYNIRDATPFERDPMRELRDACKRAGLMFGFYYSHAQDWSHPYGQRNQWDFGHPQPNARRWWEKPEWADYVKLSWRYVNEKSIPQMEELIEWYQPDIMWFDTHNWLPPEITRVIVQRARQLKPDMIINSRGTPDIFDYKSTNDRPEYFHRTEGYWEAIPTTNNSYGYHAHDKTHKPPAFFIRLLARAAGRGGNLLMNVGPMGNGKIDPTDVEILAAIGRWLKVNGDSIYGAERTPLALQAWGDSSVRGNVLYLHVFDWPRNGKLVAGGVTSEPVRAWLLADPERKPLAVRRLDDRDIEIDIPAAAPDPVDSVIAVEMDGPVTGTRDAILLSTHVRANVLHVFEGELHGPQIAFGGGNVRSNFISRWRDPSAYVSWPVRLREPGLFEVAVRYTADEKMLGNRFAVEIGRERVEGEITKTGRHVVATLGRVKLSPGTCTLAVKPVKIASGDLVRLTDVRLVPVR